MLESKFQSDLKNDILKRLPGSMVLKNDPNWIQGIPDLLILYKNHWAALEVKRAPGAAHQPNQDFYVQELNGWSYAAFINPDNKEDILDELQSALRPHRKARISRG